MKTVNVALFVQTESAINLETESPTVPTTSSFQSGDNKENPASEEFTFRVVNIFRKEQSSVDNPSYCRPYTKISEAAYLIVRPIVLIQVPVHVDYETTAVNPNDSTLQIETRSVNKNTISTLKIQDWKHRFITENSVEGTKLNEKHIKQGTVESILKSPNVMI